MFSSIKSRRHFITQIDKREVRGPIFSKAIVIITKDIEVIDIIYDTVVNYSSKNFEKQGRTEIDV